MISFNFTHGANFAVNPEYIIIHDTGNTDPGANADMHYEYFNGGNRKSSAHVFCDDSQILQIIEFEDMSWNCGDGGNQYGIGNGNTLSIEICINSDGDYEKSVKNAIEITFYLMKTYDIPIDRVVRHYDASRKICPGTMYDNGNWTGWINFKNILKARILDMFNDENEISDYAKPSVDRLGQLGVFKGDNNGNFNPKNAITREDMACVIDKVLKLLGK
jgi:N-acetylmuramoyl-L-alanine amidase CwlA